MLKPNICALMSHKCLLMRNNNVLCSPIFISSLSLKLFGVFDCIDEMYSAPTYLISYKALILFLVSKVCALSQGDIHKVRGIRIVHTIKVYVNTQST